MLINCPCGHCATPADFNETIWKGFKTIVCDACGTRAAWRAVSWQTKNGQHFRNERIDPKHPDLVGKLAWSRF